LIFDKWLDKHRNRTAKKTSLLAVSRYNRYLNYATWIHIANCIFQANANNPSKLRALVINGFSFTYAHRQGNLKLAQYIVGNTLYVWWSFYRYN